MQCTTAAVGCEMEGLNMGFRVSSGLRVRKNLGLGLISNNNQEID